MESTRYCPWATAREARDQLGVSERTLARWRSSGLFQAGQHWRRKFPSANSPVQYHLEQCQAVMSEATARSAYLLELELPQFGGQVSGLHGGECTGSDELLFVFDWAEVANR